MAYDLTERNREMDAAAAAVVVVVGELHLLRRKTRQQRFCSNDVLNGKPIPTWRSSGGVALAIVSFL